MPFTRPIMNATTPEEEADKLLREAYPPPSSPIRNNDDKQKGNKSELNRKINKRLQAARKEYNRLGLWNKTKNFIHLMHTKKNQLNTKTFSWLNYHILSLEWSQTEQVDCALPKIDGLHILLREMSSKIMKKQAPPLAPAPQPTFLSILAGVASLSPVAQKKVDADLETAAKILCGQETEDKKARKELNRLGLRKQAKAFVLLMHKRMQRPFPWVNYHELSQEWGGPILPKIEGLHLILREMSAKMSC